MRVLLVSVVGCVLGSVLGSALGGCGPLNGFTQHPATCSCDLIEETSRCYETFGPPEQGETFELLCTELQEACAGVYAEGACPNNDRVAICHRARMTYTESQVVYGVGGDPFDGSSDVVGACEDYGVPEYY